MIETITLPVTYIKDGGKVFVLLTERDITEQEAYWADQKTIAETQLASEEADEAQVKECENILRRCEQMDIYLAALKKQREEMGAFAVTENFYVHIPSWKDWDKAKGACETLDEEEGVVRIDKRRLKELMFDAMVKRADGSEADVPPKLAEYLWEKAYAEVEADPLQLPFTFSWLRSGSQAKSETTVAPVTS